LGDRFSIRVIYLQPYKAAKEDPHAKRSHTDSTIQCELTRVSFGDIPKYEALSYKWDDSKSKEINVGTTRVPIQRNLWNALDLLRRETGQVRVLWADALCINQKDTEERNQQVARMGFIYKRAKMVHVWLGKSSDRILDSFGTSTELDLQWLCTNDYWKRLWIIQEICLAKKVDVIYADKMKLRRYPWDYFIDTVQRYQRELDNSAQGPLRLAQQIQGTSVSFIYLCLLDLSQLLLARCTQFY
jgi:hypothetical protein